MYTHTHSVKQTYALSCVPHCVVYPRTDPITSKPIDIQCICTCSRRHTHI